MEQTKERIEIPDTPKGQRCYEVLASIALKKLNEARDEVKDYIAKHLPTATIEDEKAMTDGKFTAFVGIPSGKQSMITYDYRTKEIKHQATV
jgi:thymidine phosphorylase